MRGNRTYHPRRPLADRFWEKVNKDGPVPSHRSELGQCWIWTASRCPKGYGRIGVVDSKRRWEEAHRVSWLIETGRHPAEWFVLHKCDNPPCVRPDHLFLGDHLANARDREAKGRGGDHSGEANGRRVLTAVDVIAIRQSGGGNADLARLYGVSKGQIIRARTGAAWQSVTIGDNGARPLHAEVTPRGSKHVKAKVTESDVSDMRAARAAGAKYADLAVAYGIGKTTAQKICRRETWTHVP